MGNGGGDHRIHNVRRSDLDPRQQARQAKLTFSQETLTMGIIDSAKEAVQLVRDIDFIEMQGS